MLLKLIMINYRFTLGNTTGLILTKKGVTLSLSRWLMLENREAVVFINFTVKRSQKKTKKTYI